jgi:hypothetical protein
MAGMIGAMIVVVAVIVGFVIFRSAFRNDVDVKPEAVDYLESVALAEDAGFDVVYPESLPSGWTATSVDLAAGDRPEWGLGVLTGSGSFVGLHQADRSVDELLDTYVDKEVTAGDPVAAAPDVAPSWETWSDEGGDRGYTAEVGSDTVLVYGSASAAEIEQFMDLLRR